MKNTKRRFEQFQIYDYTGIEIHLNQMAERGWKLHKITPFYWEYKRMEPQQITYTVTYFSEASEFNPYPTMNQHIFHEYCKKAGWDLVTEWAQMQIFSTNVSTPLPIETDDAIKLKAIHKSMKKNFLPSNFFVLLMAIFQLVLQFRSIDNHPISQLSNNTNLFLIVLWNIISLQLLVHLIGYAVWYNRSRKAARIGEHNIESSSGLRKFSNFIGILSIVAALLIMFSLLLHLGWFGLFGIVNTVVILALVYTIKRSLKHLGASRKINLSITLVSSILLSLILTGVMTWGIIYSLENGLFGNKPIATYTTTHNGYSHTWDIYGDTLPLKVEDLLEVNYEHYSYRWTKNSSLLLSHSVARQQSFPDSYDAPQLDYEIVTVSIPMIFNSCLKDYLNKYNYNYDIPEENKRYFQRTDDQTWQADAVYQLYYDNTASNEYIICWNNQIVNINFHDIPTLDQITTVIKKLRY